MYYTGLVLLFSRLVGDPGVYSLYLGRGVLVVNGSVTYRVGEDSSRICLGDRCLVSVPPFNDDEVIDYLYLVLRLSVIDRSMIDVLDYLIDRGFRPILSFSNNYVWLTGIRSSPFVTGSDEWLIIDRGAYVLKHRRVSVVEEVVIGVRVTGGVTDVDTLLNDLENLLPGNE